MHDYIIENGDFKSVRIPSISAYVIVISLRFKLLCFIKLQYVRAYENLTMKKNDYFLIQTKNFRIFLAFQTAKVMDTIVSGPGRKDLHIFKWKNPWMPIEYEFELNKLVSNEVK